MAKNILEYLERSAKYYPRATAFADEEAECTFEQLEKESRRAGTCLAQVPVFDTPVPVLMEKSVLTIQVMMGIVQAGGFYVMLDAAQPVERLNRILKTLDAKVLIVSQETKEAAERLDFSGRMISAPDLFLQEEDSGLLQEIRGRMTDVMPLYILFTSGSTGVPKGVVVSHRSVIDFIEPFVEIFGITHEDVLGNQAPWDFDVSVKDIYSGLCAGACVQLIPKKLFSFPVLLLDFLEERNVTSLTWAVSALVIVSILNGLEYKTPTRIKRIMFSGETMPIRHLNYWRAHYPDALFVNLYGPTEITCNCTYYKLDRTFEAGDILPIGTAFPNEKVFLLDEENALVEENGKTGEICVSGTALALGYYRNEEQTKQVFVQNPLNHSYLEMIYRTGDLGFYNERGELCFSSRKDFQIKHMGHRIELGEIEAALEKVAEVERSCCLFDSAKNKIVCFYQGEIDKKTLARRIGQFLPDFMVPNRFRQLEQLPITKNGKVDRRFLQEQL